MEQLGIQPVELITQIINFAIMAGGLTFFLYKPILKTLKERQKKIEEGLSYTEKMKLEAEKTESRRQSILNSAKDEASKIIGEAKKGAKTVEAEIVEKAHEEARSIVEKGRVDVEAERAEMQKKVKDQTIEIAIAMAGKVLESAFSAADQRAIVARKIKTLAKSLE